MSMHCPHSSRQGLTVTEVIIVLGLCAVVAAVLFPVFAQARERSGPTCVSNLKQLGLSMSQYLQDYNGVMPPREQATNQSKQSWRATLYPYLKSRDVFRCHSNPYWKLPVFENDGLPRSYAVNGTLGGSFGNDHPLMRPTDLTSPSTVIEICESTSSFCDFDPLNPGFFA